MIFITGGTGNIGRALCQLLADDQIPARIMCRKKEQLSQFIAQRHEAALADFDNPESVAQAMQGCTRLFLLTPPDENHFNRERAIIDMAVQAGIKHIVRISTADANLSSKLAYARSHAKVDHYLRARSVNWTILRPTGFMQNFLEYSHAISKGSLPHMMEDGQISYIDLRDIAMAVKCVLMEDRHYGATYFLTGPASLTVSEVAVLLTNALDQKVEAKNIPEAEMRNMLSYSGMGAWQLDALIEQFLIGANGCEIDVTEELRRITGKPPRNISHFIEDYKQDFLTPEH